METDETMSLPVACSEVGATGGQRVGGNLLSALPHDDGRARVLAHGKRHARRNVGVLEKLQRDEPFNATQKELSVGTGWGSGAPSGHEDKIVVLVPVLVVLRRLRVLENGRELREVGGAEQVGNVDHGFLGQQPHSCPVHRQVLLTVDVDLDKTHATTHDQSTQQGRI